MCESCLIEHSLIYWWYSVGLHCGNGGTVTLCWLLKANLTSSSLPLSVLLWNSSVTFITLSSCPLSCLVCLVTLLLSPEESFIVAIVVCSLCYRASHNCLALHLLPHHLDQFPRQQLREERCVLAHGFRQFDPWSFSSVCVGRTYRWREPVAKGSSSLYGRHEEQSREKGQAPKQPLSTHVQ